MRVEIVWEKDSRQSRTYTGVRMVSSHGSNGNVVIKFHHQDDVDLSGVRTTHVHEEEEESE